MRYQFPDPDLPLDAAWLAPLLLVFSAIADHPHRRWFDPSDFMIMGRLMRGPRPSIVEYKHVFTRRYLQVDDAGQTYRYVQAHTKHGPQGRYLRCPLDRAIWRIGLWELPWLKPGLEHEREGRTWDEPWEPPPAAAVSTEGGGRRGHLRLV